MGRKPVGIYLDERIDRKLEYFSYKLDAKKSQLIELALKVLFELLEDRADCIVASPLDEELQRLKEKIVPEAEVI